MSNTLVFIHGACVTPLCWEKMIGFFQGKGYACVAPAWPHRDKPIEELRREPPAELAGLGVTEIVAHYERIIKEFPEPPILIGHSFGGLFVQILLDRGLGAAGIAIDSAPPRGVLPLQWSTIKANAGVLSRWRGWKGIVYQSFKQFQYAFVHTLPEAEQRAAYDTHVVPETGRIFFQAALALLDPHRAVQVNFEKADRAPLLLIAGTEDRIVPAALNRANYRKYQRTSARTDFKEFAGRVHWIIAQDGWEEVADYIARWLDQLTGEKGNL